MLFCSQKMTNKGIFAKQKRDWCKKNTNSFNNLVIWEIISIFAPDYKKNKKKKEKRQI